jgi:hypothetical protein
MIPADELSGKEAGKGTGRKCLYEYDGAREAVVERLRNAWMDASSVSSSPSQSCSGSELGGLECCGQWSQRQSRRSHSVKREPKWPPQSSHGLYLVGPELTDWMSSSLRQISIDVETKY